MPRYIDAEKFRDWILKQKRLSKHYTVQMLDETPPADVEEVRHGYWIEEDGVQICSECGEEHEWEEYRATYCENCGAKMDGRAHTEEVG